MKKVHIIPHTHWDREWYFNTSRSTIFLLKHVKEVLEVLESQADFRNYILDAQTSLLEDYLAYHPEDRSRLEKLIKERRLFVGPWYTQTDQLVISQESVVRNLLYGQQKAEEFGHSFNLAYVPDAFGQGGNMPQIYRSFGIETALFWRGIADSTFADTQFIWQGTDGSQVYGTVMRHGYNYGGEHGLPEEAEGLKDYVKDFVDTVSAEANTKHVYFPYGHDQSPIRENLPELVERLNQLDEDHHYIMGNAEDYFKELVSDYGEDLKVIEGELTQAKHSRIHKSIFSTRADLKQKNNQIENYLTNVLEPLLVVAENLGLEYPHRLMERIWKLMFENAAHDSIGGCNSDSTNRDVDYRYKLVRDLATNLLDRTMRTIANRIHLEKDLNLILFNPKLQHYSGLIDFQAYVPSLDFEIYEALGDQAVNYVIEEATDLTDYVLKQTIQVNPSQDIYRPDQVYLVEGKLWMEDLKSLGYKTLYLKSVDQVINNRYLEQDDLSIENYYYRIELQDNNALSIRDKLSGELYKDQMIFVESGDDGDSYNFSPPRQDLRIQSTQAKRLKQTVKTSDLRQVLSVKLAMNVPKDLEDRAKGICSAEMALEVNISLVKDSPLIQFEAVVDNQVLSHKLAVQFDTAIASQFSYANHLFGQIKRPVYLEEMKVWEEEEWEETPISIEPMQSYVALSDPSQTYALMTEGVREYEIVGEDYSVIQLTLFRTFGYMGKEDLLYRPGRASGEPIVATPDAQLLGEIRCEFAAYINSAVGIESINLSKLSKDYLSPVQVYQQSDFLNGRMIFSQKREKKTLAKEFSLGTFDHDDLTVSALKASSVEPGKYILRVFNPYLTKEIELKNPYLSYRQVELDEKTSADDKEILKPNQFVSFEIGGEEL